MNANVLVGLFTFANFNQYTGLEHTRVSDMLFILAIISVVMWVAVCVSMVARVSAKLLLKVKNKRTNKDVQAG